MGCSAVVRRLGRTLMVTGAILATGLVGSAVAGGGNQVHLNVPKRAKVSTPYTITVSGFAARTERVYLFVDYNRCGANPRVEHRRANGVYTKVQGSFSAPAKGWESPRKGVEHACAYLQRRSAPLNSAKGILARAAAWFRIH